MKRKAPDVIALTGKKARDNNCFSAVLYGPDGDEILVSAVGAHGIVGRAWSGERFENETIIPNEHLGEFAVRISRYFGEHYFDYNSALSCIVGEISWRPWRTLVVNKIVQQVFNAKTPIRSKRIRILKRLIQDRIDDAITHGGLTRRDFQGKSAIQLLGEIHGLRIVRHPEFIPMPLVPAQW